MSTTSSQMVPPGWYPDPAGSRQWRVWTGEKWSEMTKPYGETRANTSLVVNVSLAQSLRRTATFGVLGVIGGIGLLVSVTSHWPGTVAPTSTWFAYVASGVAIALLVIGSVVSTFAVYDLRGRWTIDAFVPVVNLFVVSSLVSTRLGRPAALRLGSDVILLVVFALSSHANVWLGVAPVIVAFSQSMWIHALIDQLIGAQSTPSPTGT
ncbi:MAG: DUF2510 domain-containing protein [Acidimicrobiales bacterium]